MDKISKTSNSILLRMSRISAASGKWLGWRATMHSCSSSGWRSNTRFCSDTWTRSRASVQRAGGGHWKHWTLWIVLCTDTSSRNTGSSMIVAKEVRPAMPCKLEEEVEVEVVTLPKHLPISSTSTTALREKVGLSNKINTESVEWVVTCPLHKSVQFVWSVLSGWSMGPDTLAGACR